MRILTIVTACLVFVTAAADARLSKHDYPSCDIAAQRGLKVQMGGSIKDAEQAHLVMRTNILEADLGNARKARRLTQAKTDTLVAQVGQVRVATDTLGSGLVDQSQKMTVAASAMAEKKVVGQRS